MENRRHLVVGVGCERIGCEAVEGCCLYTLYGGRCSNAGHRYARGFKSMQSRKMANEGSEGDLEVEKPPSL